MVEKETDIARSEVDHFGVAATQPVREPGESGRLHEVGEGQPSIFRVSGIRNESGHQSGNEVPDQALRIPSRVLRFFLSPSLINLR